MLLQPWSEVLLLECATSSLHGPLIMSGYTPAERRAVAALAGIFSLRMLGLFMILPVFAIYGTGLAEATPQRIGLAVGAYGLAQLLLQIPFGLLADRMDRRLLVIAGLLLFVAGGLVAAGADTIWGVIAGRFLQGAGAISAVVMALATDLVRETHRTKALATLGMSIGMAFALAFVLGPMLAARTGLSGLFAITALLGLLAIALCLALVPAGGGRRELPEAWRLQLRRVAAQGQLARINAGIFILHLVLTACFVVLPGELVQEGLPASRHGLLYLPVMLLAFLTLVPAVIVAEKRQQMARVYRVAIGLLMLALLVLADGRAGLTVLITGVALFFFAFNLLEALLPSLVSKLSSPADKGTAMGLYSTCQFLGAFLGGVLGGWLEQLGQVMPLFLTLAGLSLLWLLLTQGMQVPRRDTAL